MSSINWPNSVSDVTGPIAGSTDNAVARFDGTTGTVLQNSTATLSDAGVLTASGFVGPLTGNVTGNVTGNLTGNVTGNCSGSAGSFTGSLVGDVTGTQGATVVSLVGGSTAANVHAAELLANAAASANAASAIVKRDGSGNFVAGTITANLTGDVTGTASGNPPNARTISTTAPLTGGGDLSTNRTIAIPAATSSVNGYLTSADWSTFNNKQASGNYITALTGDVSASGAGSVAATVNSVGGSSAANIHAAELIANAARVIKSNVNVTTDVTLTDGALHFVTTSSARSLTLPAPSATRYIVVKDATGSCGTNNITIVRAASEKIETVAASYVLDMDLGSWTFVSDGTDYFII